MNTQGAAYVFTRPAGGWSDESEAAKLIASDGRVGDGFGSSVAISGPTVGVASGIAGDSFSGGEVYVFTKPRGGWSGTLYEDARLTVPGRRAGGLGPVAMSGNTIAVAALDPQAGHGAVYVFKKPPRGWHGTVHQSAKLATSPGSQYSNFPTSLATSGRDVFATSFAGSPQGKGVVFVFSEPKRGWKGTIHERAKLTARSMTVASVAPSGSSVVAAIQSRPFSAVCELVAFEKPVRGWSGTRLPTARLRLTPPPLGSSGCLDVVDLADSGGTIAALPVGPWSSSCPPFPGACGEMLYTFSRPARGWHGTIRSDANATITPPNGYGGTLAIEGQTIATASGDAIDIFAHTVR